MTAPAKEERQVLTLSILKDACFVKLLIASIHLEWLEDLSQNEDIFFPFSTFSYAYDNLISNWQTVVLLFFILKGRIIVTCTGCYM